MKRTLLVFVTGLAMLVAAACTTEPAGGSEDDPLLVIATFTIIGDLVEGVAGDHADVRTMVPLGGDPHTYEPVPSDVRLLARADVVFDNGLGLSPWFEPLRNQASGTVVDLSLELREEALAAHDGDIDPHMWLSVPFAARYVDVIEQTLADADPDNRDQYAHNADDYRAQLDELDTQMREWFDTIPQDNRKLVTYEDAFNYFAADYGFEILATAVGPTTEEEPSADRIRWLVDRVRESAIPTIFVESLVDARVIANAARDAGVDLAAQALHIDSVGEPGSGAETYIEMMRLNARTIVEGLGGQIGDD